MKRASLLVLIVLAACGAPSEDVASSEDNVEVWPELPENLGYVKIVLPENADRPIDDTSYVFMHDMSGAPAGTPEKLALRPGVAQRARRGYGTFVLASGNRRETLTIDVKAGETATIDLALLSLSYDPSVTTLAVEPDFGPRPSVTSANVWVDDVIVNDVGPSGLDGTKSRYAPVLARELTLRTTTVPGDVANDVVIDLRARRIQTVKVERGAQPDLPSEIHFEMAPRVLPDAIQRWCDGVLVASRTIVLATRPGAGVDVGAVHDDPRESCWAGSSFAQDPDLPYWEAERESIERALEVPTSRTLRVHPARGSYALMLSGVYKVPFYPSAGASFTMRVERIDVHDITVAREDGTTFTERGWYRLQKKELNGTEYYDVPGVPTELPTNTGIDVIPGEYRVTTYCHAADCDESRTYDLDLR